MTEDNRTEEEKAVDLDAAEKKQSRLEKIVITLAAVVAIVIVVFTFGPTSHAPQITASESSDHLTTSSDATTVTSSTGGAGGEGGLYNGQGGASDEGGSGPASSDVDKEDIQSLDPSDMTCEL